MTPADLAAVMAVQTDCYPAAMVEDAATLAARLGRAAGFAWVAEDAGGICAYLVTYPSRRGKVTRLGAAFDVSAAPDCLYLHDLAVAPRAAGRALGPALVRAAWQEAQARGWRHSALVSVQSSQGFWERLGYRACADLAAGERAHLESYSGPACYMVKMLDSTAKATGQGIGAPCVPAA